MTQTIDHKADQCLNDIQKYERWGNLLAGQSWVHLFNSNAPVSMSAIHNGLECIKAKMKLYVLQDNQHNNEEKEKRLKQKAKKMRENALKEFENEIFDNNNCETN